MNKIRIDKKMVESGLVKSRQEAQRRVMAGEVWIENQRISKPSTMIPMTAEIRLTGSELPYVSRGGLKLEAALAAFSLDVKGKTALDIGASTGGFTDCLLQHGANHVFAVDVGYGQIAWRLRQDNRVTVIERTNARYLSPAVIPDPVQIFTIDVSFISLKRILPAVYPLLSSGGWGVMLIKPQFEVGKGEVGKGGIVKDSKKHRRVIEEISSFSRYLGLKEIGRIPSPILGAKGNREFLMAVEKPWA